MKYARHLYQARHLIENFFNKLKQYRDNATRSDKTACNFLAALHLAAAVICQLMARANLLRKENISLY